VETSAIHRIVEHHAAMRGDAVAIAGNCQAVTYRDLNHRANHAARRLHAFGFHRGDVAFVRMPRSVDLAVVLLAVLKAGGSYAWAAASADEASLTLAHDCDAGSPTIAVDVRALLTADTHAAPNLPIITRASDTACVLRDEPDGAAVLVPHVTVTALRQAAHTGRRHWRGDAGALDLLLLLVGGGTALLDRDAVTAAAA
jgi:non-ribosomal peptide synthetase component E (peptide arylation enzyme)